MKTYFLPDSEAGQALWLSNFASKLPTYTTKYGISTTEVTDMQNSNAWYQYWIDYKNKFTEYLKKLTEFKAQIARGVSSGAQPAITPTIPPTATAPTAVAPGVIQRAISLAARIKSYQSYSRADGNDLGIEGNEATVDLINVKPELTIVLKAGSPFIKWKKQKMQAVKLYVCRDGSDNFELLNICYNANYTDTAPLPEINTSEVWRYKAIYRYKDAEVGIWSDEMSITVTGNL